MRKFTAIIITVLCFVFVLLGIFREPQPSLSKEVTIAERDYFHAAYIGDVGLMQDYLEKGIKPNTINPKAQEMTALMYASWGGNVEAIRYLLANGAEVNQRKANGATALMLAAYANQEDAARVLLENGAIPDLKDNKHNTALMFAVVRGNLSLIRLLADKGMGLHQRGRLARSPLSIAAVMGKRDAVRTILASPLGRTLANTNDASAKNPLMLASKHGRLEIVRELLPKTQNINAKDIQGKTALDLAERLPSGPNKLAITQLLISNGAVRGGPIIRNRNYEVPNQGRR